MTEIVFSKKATKNLINHAKYIYEQTKNEDIRQKNRSFHNSVRFINENLIIVIF